MSGKDYSSRLKKFFQQKIKFFKRLKPDQKILTFAFIIFFFLGLFVRFYKLSEIPISLYHDEMDYVFTGEALARFGTDITGQWRVGQLRPLKTLNYTAELPALFHALSQLFFGFGPSTGHLPAAIFGLLTVLLLAYFVYRLSKNYFLSLVALLLIMLNPWHVHLSRMGYEAVISLFFQVIFLLSVFLISTYKNRQISAKVIFYYLLLFSSLFLTFFTYHGSKFLAVVLVFAACIWIFFQKQSTKRKLFFSFSLFFLLGLLLFHTINLQQAGQFGLRDAEIFSLDSLSQLVDKQRKLSFSNQIEEIFINKAVVLLKELLSRYLFVFDPYRLTISGYESGFQFSLVVHGFFYLSSIPLFLIGLKWWLKNYQRIFYFLLLFILVSPITSAITIGYQAIFRSALTYLLLLVFIAGGVAASFEYLAKFKKKTLLSFALLLFFFLESSNFTYNYLSRYGIVSADNHYFFEELLAAYVKRLDQSVLILADKGKAYSLARSIVAYNQLMPELTAQQREQFADSTSVDYHLPNVVISETCPNLVEETDTIQVVDLGMFKRCQYEEFMATAAAEFKENVDEKFLSISSPIDSGAYYFLLNDPLCNQEELKHFVFTDQLADFSPGQMIDEDFCQTWIKKEH